VRDLQQSIEIAAPIEAVWAEITKLRGVQRALMDTVLETSFQPGDPLYYKSRDGKRTFIVGRIVEVRPPELLAHTQVLTTRDYAPTLVTWRLSSTATGGTRVTVEHTGWQDGDKGVDSVDSTWAWILRELKNVLENGSVASSTAVKYGVMRAFLWAMPARTRTDRITVPDWMPTAFPEHPGDTDSTEGTGTSDGHEEMGHG
jgi:uncharacterized protein YndB with AHSA1/START domain